jgi:hypothetical protein
VNMRGQRQFLLIGELTLASNPTSGSQGDINVIDNDSFGLRIVHHDLLYPYRLCLFSRRLR